MSLVGRSEQEAAISFRFRPTRRSSRRAYTPYAPTSKCERALPRRIMKGVPNELHRRDGAWSERGAKKRARGEERTRRRARERRARGEGGWACTNTPSVSPTILVAASSPLQRFTEVTFEKCQQWFIYPRANLIDSSQMLCNFPESPWLNCLASLICRRTSTPLCTSSPSPR